MNKPFGYMAGVSLALGLLCAPAAAEFITFQVPGATYTYAVAITNTGGVIGSFGDQSGQHGFLRAPDGTITTIDVPLALYTYAAAISGDGTIVGFYGLKNRSGWQGFIRAPDGQITKVRAPAPDRYTSPASIANTGWIAGTAERSDHIRGIVGFLRDPSGQFTEFGRGLYVYCANSTNTTAGAVYAGTQLQSFVRTPDGVITQFNPDGASYSGVFAINNSGTATGYFRIRAIEKGFVRASDGTISTFAADQDARVTQPADINKNGTIAGYYRNKDRNYHGFLRAPDGTITTIDVPGGSDTQLFGINAAGQAVGGFKLNGVPEGFIWQP